MTTAPRAVVAPKPRKAATSTPRPRNKSKITAVRPPIASPPKAKPVRSQASSGKDARAIARWDVIPFRIFDKPTNLGVVAFHINGIDRVEFTVEGNKVRAIKTPTVNKRTGVIEYHFLLDPAKFKDGTVKIDAVAYPTLGLPRALPQLIVNANSGGSLKGKSVYAAPKGADKPGGGTTQNPFATIAFALKSAGEGGTVILRDEGWYTLKGSAGRSTATGTRWTTVRAAQGLDRNKIVLGMPERKSVRLQFDKVRFERVSIDLGSFFQIYPEQHQMTWMVRTPEQ